LYLVISPPFVRGEIKRGIEVIASFPLPPLSPPSQREGGD